jgi:hypothetical protein
MKFKSVTAKHVFVATDTISEFRFLNTTGTVSRLVQTSIRHEWKVHRLGVFD